jgi:hypothetical protein
MIIDLRKDEFATREKELCKLAEDILWQGAISNCRNIVGEFIRRRRDYFNSKGMGELCARHFDTAEWRIKKLLGNRVL